MASALFVNSHSMHSFVAFTRSISGEYVPIIVSKITRQQMTKLS